MIKALKKEKHQGPLVNNPSFRFSCNIDEQYLSHVESSSDTSKISQVRKKIAGRFSSGISYSILTTARFIESISGELLTILLPEHLILSKMKREILTNEVYSVYGKNKCYLDSFKTSESTSEPKLGKPRCIPLSSLTKDSVWRQSKAGASTAAVRQ